MDHRSKCNTYNCKTSRRKHLKNLCNLNLGKDFLDKTLKTCSIIEEIHGIGFIKILKDIKCSSKDIIFRWY